MTPKAPRLTALAKAINEKVPGVVARVQEAYVNTDRKIPGSRLRSPGKGRHGNRLFVWDSDSVVVIDHNSAETYRTNAEAAEQVEKLWGRIWEPGATLDPKILEFQKKLRTSLHTRGFARNNDYSFSWNSDDGYLQVQLYLSHFHIQGRVGETRVNKTYRYNRISVKLQGVAGL